MLLRGKRIAILGVFTAIAIVLSILENALMGMTNFIIPGLKPGLANIAVVLALYYLGGTGAVIVGLVKATASFLATGGAYRALVLACGERTLGSGHVAFVEVLQKCIFSRRGERTWRGAF